MSKNLSEEDKKGLIAQRDRVKASLSILEKYLAKIGEEPIANQHDYAILLDRAESLPPLMLRFNELQEQLELDEDAQSDEIELFHNRYYSVRADFKLLISQYKEFELEENESEAQLAEGATCSPLNVKLPDINLPMFDGKYSEWITFRDIFTAIVIENKQLAGVAKFFYLNSSLQGEPKTCISNIPITEANFAVAWHILVERYDNTRLIATDHIHKLFAPPAVEPITHTSLRRLVDYFTSNVQALEALELPVALDKLLLSQLLLNNLNSQLVSEWEANSVVDTVPSFEDLLAFLEKKCKVLELSSTSPATVNNVLAKDQSSFKNTFANVVKKNLCPSCKENHALYLCSQFRALTPQQRFDFVKKHRLCMICLKLFTPGHPCSKFRCRHCNKDHNSLLHFSPNSNANNSDRSQAQTYVARASHKTHCNTQSRSRNTQRVNEPKPNLNTKVNSCLLPTAEVCVSQNNKVPSNLNALLDSASDCHLITERAVKRLRLKTSYTNTHIQGVVNTANKINKVTRVNVNSNDGKFVSNITCYVVPNITTNLPHANIDIAKWNLPLKLPYADPNFHVSKPIDLLPAAISTQGICIHLLSMQCYSFLPRFSSFLESH